MTPKRSALLVSLVLSAALGLGACSSDFDPPSYLKDLRVLAITSDKLEAGPTETVTLLPQLYAPPPATITKVEWSFCPFSFGSAVAFACISPLCETALTTHVNQGTTATPGALAASCFAALSAAADGGLPIGGSLATLPRTLDTLFRVKVTASDGAVFQALQRFPLYPFAEPTARNRSPIVTSVTVGGMAPDEMGRFPAQSAALPLQETVVEVTLDPASAEAYTDDSGVAYTEDPILSFYATAGRFKQDRSSGLRSNVAWKAEKLLPTDTEVVLYVVARDLRGGATLAGPYRWAIARP